MNVDNLLVERDGAVARLTINRPDVLNALDTSTIDGLRRAMLECQHDARVRAVVITGAGGKAFVAGADINELATLRAAQAREQALLAQRMFDTIENLGKPVVAAINGYALGGGCELAMACTLRVAADTARLGLPEIALGIMPGYGGTQRLARLVGKGVALEMLLTGRQVAADEALRMGLVNRVVPAAGLPSASMTLAAELGTRAPVAVRYIIDAVNRGLEMPFEDAQFLEATLFGLVASTDDSREGIRAFLDKRKAEFKGR